MNSFYKKGISLSSNDNIKAYDNLEPQFRLKKDCEKKIQNKLKKNEQKDSALLINE